MKEHLERILSELVAIRLLHPECDKAAVDCLQTAETALMIALRNETNPE